MVASRFLSIRTHLGLSQQSFSNVLGISLRSEQNYERGERQLPIDVLFSLANIYDIDPLWVLNGKEESPRYLKNRGNLNTALLDRSLKVVFNAVRLSEKDIASDQASIWTSAIYRFYIENPSGKGEEELVKSLIGAR